MPSLSTQKQPARATTPATAATKATTVSPARGNAAAAEKIAAANAPTELTPLNSQRPGSAQASAPVPEGIRALAAKGYIVTPAADMEVLNTVGGPGQKGDAAVASQGPKYDVVANGTFYAGRDPVGPIVRDGMRDTGGYGMCADRGGVARLKDGSIVVGRTRGGNADQISAAFGASKDNPVDEAMGGGALLIEGGRTVSDKDLRERQNFKQGVGGIQAAQMRQTTHSLMGIANGQAYHVWAKAKSGAQIQKELLAAGFTSLVMLDGGGAGFFDNGSTRSTARDPALTGLGITKRQ
jgi:hypothetical protein